MTDAIWTQTGTRWTQEGGDAYMEVEGVKLYRGDAASLQPRKWLTEAIINAAVRLWLHRPLTGVVAANTFFMSTLCSAAGTNSGYNYSQVANWMNGWG